MGTAKLDEFTLKDNKTALYARALAHPARIAIIRLLLKKRTCICGEIVNELPLSQSTVSQHLHELKKAGLINGTIEGKRICYCLNEEEWKQAKLYLGGLLDTAVAKIKCC
ncbi:MAG: transcriptional regulator [Chitinophagales bacterium]|nr:MAG: transcriptional regulator [Chitinophagales bacterium]